MLIALAVVAGIAHARDEPDAEKARAVESLAKANKQAATYAFRRQGGAAFQLRPEPVLKWSNSAIGTVYSHVYVWTEEGRPEVIGSFQSKRPVDHIWKVA